MVSINNANVFGAIRRKAKKQKKISKDKKPRGIVKLRKAADKNRIISAEDRAGNENYSVHTHGA